MPGWAGLRALWRECVETAKARPAESAFIALAILLDPLFTASLPLAFKMLADEVVARHDLSGLVRLLGALAVGAVVVAAAGILLDLFYARFVTRLLNGLRRRMFGHLTRLSADFHARHRAGTLLQHFSGDLASVEHGLVAAPGWALVPLLDVLFSTILLFALDWRLALPALLVFPVCLLGPRLMMYRAMDGALRRKHDEALVADGVQEGLAAQAVVKAFGLEQVSIARQEQRLARLARSSVRMCFLNALLERSSNIGTLLLQVLILAAGGLMAFHGLVSIGALAAFQAAFLTLNWSLGYLSQYFPTLLTAAAGMQRVEGLLRQEPTIIDPPGAASLPPLAHEIQFENVSFAYGAAQPSLEALNLVIRAGESVAFVGASGAGKSTVLALLMRLYDPSAGSIRFDGQDIRHVTQASLRGQAGVVFQDCILFDTTIRENIRLGLPGASDAQVEAAARAAELHDAILAMSEGYETQVGDRGGRLSGGQRQRVAIARAMIREPRLLLLDEATSALDPTTEAALNATLERVARGRTLIAVSHRLAACINRDRIFVLDQGRIAEAGTHAALLAHGGHYTRLWASQLDASRSPSPAAVLAD